MLRVCTSLAAAFLACFLFFFLLLLSHSLAEHIEFDVWHRLGSPQNSKWRPAGTLSGQVDTEALVDAASAALRGGGGRVSPPKSASPVLKLVRDEKNAISAEEAARAAERGQSYSLKLVRKFQDHQRSSSKKNPKFSSSSSRALFTSAPPHCAAAALTGALPLKLDGSLPRSTSGGGEGGGIRVTGVSFDFYGGGGCKGGGGGKGKTPQAQQQQQQRVPLWLPAAAPPLLPPPPPPAAAKKAAAAAALAQAQAEAARRRAANGGGEGGEEGEAEPPPPDNRTWLQKNWVYALPMFMMAMNVMNAAAGPPPQQPQRRGQAAAVAGAGAAAAAAGAAAAGAGTERGASGVEGVASLD